MRSLLWVLIAGLVGAFTLGVAVAQDAPVVVEEDDLTSDAWHPIAYVTDAEDGPPQILSAGPGYGSPFPLSAGYNVGVLGPQGQSPMAWRPDGSQLAFVSDTGNASAVVLTTLQGETRVLAQGLPARAYAPQWSPSGSFLTVLAPEGAGMGLHLIQSADGRSTRISSGAIQRAVWAGNADVLAIVKSGGVEVWTPEQGQALHVPGTESVGARVSWSADGQLLAIDGVLAGGGKASSSSVPPRAPRPRWAPARLASELVEMNPAREELLALRPVSSGALPSRPLRRPGRTAENLTTTVGPDFVTPESVTAESPLARYSPTGQYVAFVAHPLDSMLARTSTSCAMAGLPVCVSEPVGVQTITWSRDGSRVAPHRSSRLRGAALTVALHHRSHRRQVRRLGTNVLAYSGRPRGRAGLHLPALALGGWR